MFLGIDLGTSSIKAVLADKTGTMVAAERAEYPVYYPQEGWAEQNPEDWLNGLTHVLYELGKHWDLTLVEGIGFCGQMHGLVLLDERDKVIRPALLWNDNRTTEEVFVLNREIGKKKLIERTGNVALTGFTAPKLLWVRNHEPERFARIAKLILPKDYLVYRISGVFASDVTDASGTLMFDTEHRRWSKPMLEFLGITEEQLPTAYESWQPVGTVLPDFAAQFGLNPKAKVIVGGGDQAVGAVGTGTVKDGQMFLSLGTSGVIFAPSNHFIADSKGRLHSFCHANGKYHMMGCILSAAAALDWWMEAVLGRRDFDTVLTEAGGSEIDDLLFWPYLMGERSPINDPNARGVFSGLSLQKGRASMTRAILEGVAFALRDCYEVMKEQGMTASFARIIGGGARSPIWIQILADVLGLELRTIFTADGGALGAVMLAMTGCGRFTSVEDAAQQLVHDKQAYYPDEKRRLQYEKKFAAYRANRPVSGQFV